MRSFGFGSFLPTAASSPGAAGANGYGIPLGSGQTYGKQCSNHLKQVSITAGSTQNLLNVTGSGVMTYVFIAMQGDQNARVASYFNVYIDGEATPSVSVAMNMLTNSVRGPVFKSRFIGTETSGNNFSGYLFIKAPFKSSLRVDLVSGSTTSLTLWSIVQYAIGGTYNWGNYGKLHSQAIGTNAVLASVAPYAEFNLLNYSGGPGVLHGLNIVINSTGSTGTSWAALEGLVQVYVDGEATPSYSSSGTEDYFGGSFYFQGGVFATDYCGLTSINGTAYAATCYRWHIEDPIVFNTSIRYTWTNGNTGAGNVQSANATLLGNVWYYTAS